MRADKMKLQLWIVAIVALAVAVKMTSATPPPDVSVRGIVATQHSGNDFINEQNVCYKMYQKGYISEYTSDMVGIKVDPPNGISNGVITTTKTSNQYLSFTLTNAVMVGVIMKGGNRGHNVYNYESVQYTNDQRLQCPTMNNGNIPTISHYHVCYKPASSPTTGPTSAPTTAPTNPPPDCTQCVEANTLNTCTNEIVPALVLADESFQGSTMDCHLQESVCQVEEICEEVNGILTCSCSEEACMGYAEGCAR